MYSYDSVMSGPSEWKFIENLKYLPPPVTDEQLMKTEGRNPVHEGLMNHLSNKFIEIWGPAPSETVQEQKVEAESSKLMHQLNAKFIQKYSPLPYVQAQKVESPIHNENVIQHSPNMFQKNEAIAKVNPEAPVTNKIHHEETTENHVSLKTKIEFPAPKGPVVSIHKKLYVPVHDFPGYNFVGRLIGPDGCNIREISYQTGCYVSVRGKGRDPRGPTTKDEEDLHVMIWCRDSRNICQIKVDHAVDQIMEFLIPEDF